MSTDSIELDAADLNERQLAAIDAVGVGPDGSASSNPTTSRSGSSGSSWCWAPSSMAQFFSAVGGVERRSSSWASSCSGSTPCRSGCSSTTTTATSASPPSCAPSRSSGAASPPRSASRIQANGALLSFWAKVMGQPWAHDWAAGFTAPFAEELSKAAGLVLLIVLAPKLVRSAFDGFILGAFIGLGFQVFEDVLYVANSSAAAFGSHPEASAIQVIAPAGHHRRRDPHPLLGDLLRRARVVHRLDRREPPRRWLGLGLMLLVLPLHGALDVAPAFGSAVFLINGVIAIIEIVRRHHRVPHRLAPRARTGCTTSSPPKSPTGTITQPELDAMAGSRKDRKHFVRAAHGHRNHVQAKHVIHAATDLAEEIAKAGGHESDGVLHARSELARVRA